MSVLKTKDGDVVATAFIGDGSQLTGIVSIPTGLISMWSGAASAIPSGWFLCDGANGTPNLVGKFIKGGSTAGATGGSTSTAGHTLTIAEIPSHNHSGNIGTGGASFEHHQYNSRPPLTTWSTTTGSTGGSGAHSHNMEPVYFQLCYIMKG